VIVAVFSMGMMQMLPHNEVDMIGVRHLLVAAAVSVGVSDLVSSTLMRRSASGRVLSSNCDPVLVYVAIVHSV